MPSTHTFSSIAAGPESISLSCRLKPQGQALLSPPLLAPPGLRLTPRTGLGLPPCSPVPSPTRRPHIPGVGVVKTSPPKGKAICLPGALGGFPTPFPSLLSPRPTPGESLTRCRTSCPPRPSHLARRTLPLPQGAVPSHLRAPVRKLGNSLPWERTLPCDSHLGPPNPPSLVQAAPFHSRRSQCSPRRPPCPQRGGCRCGAATHTHGSATAPPSCRSRLPEAALALRRLRGSPRLTWVPVGLRDQDSNRFLPSARRRRNLPPPARRERPCPPPIGSQPERSAPPFRPPLASLCALPT